MASTRSGLPSLVARWTAVVTARSVTSPRAPSASVCGGSLAHGPGLSTGHAGSDKLGRPCGRLRPARRAAPTVGGRCKAVLLGTALLRGGLGGEIREGEVVQAPGRLVRLKMTARRGQGIKHQFEEMQASDIDAIAVEAGAVAFELYEFARQLRGEPAIA